LRYTQGEDELKRFIKLYNEGKPPMILSDGFPEDLLPRPILPEPPIDDSLSLKEQRKQFQKRKDIKKVKYLTRDEFEKALRGELFEPSDKGNYETRMVTLKNQINRLTGTTAGEGDTGGHLFSFDQYRWKYVSIYAKIDDDFIDTAKQLFKYIEQSGYGKRKSVGYGQVTVEEFKEFKEFPNPPDANGFISLSSFVPAEKDPVRGYWQVLVKYGKLGEEFATSENPFKKPLIMFTAGSCFYDSHYKEYYGRLIKDLTTVDENIVQYGLALALPIKLPIGRE
jgi:CRISPR-associated protein Csm4